MALMTCGTTGTCAASSTSTSVCEGCSLKFVSAFSVSFATSGKIPADVRSK